MSTRALVMSLSKTPVEHESFPEGCERSLDGALRLLPNFPVEVSLGELEALEAAGVELKVLIKPEPPAPAPAPKKSPAPAAKKEAPKKEAPKKKPAAKKIKES